MKTKHTRAGRTGSLRLSRTARAVRAALLASTAALAFAGAPAAFAQSCTQTATNTVTCTGVFTDDVYNSVPPANQTPDLTIIVADTNSTTPSTVNPADGVAGISSSGGGDVTIINYADINTYGADAIYAYGSDTATVHSYGDLTTFADDSDDNAIDASALNDVDVVVGGNVYVYNDAAVNVTAVSAVSYQGNVTVLADYTADITASAYDGNALGLISDAYLDSDVTIDGSVSAMSTYGYATGVVSSAYNGDASLTVNGTVSADGYGQAIGAVDGSKYGNALVSNYGDVSATSYLGTAVGLFTYAGGYADVYNAGTISASSSYGSAVAVAAYGGDVYFNNTGSISASGYDVAGGALLAAAGYVYAGNTGSISADAYGDTYASATGLGATGTTVNVYNAGTISASAGTAGAYGTAYATGVAASGTDVAFDNEGMIEAYASGDYALAIGADLSATNTLGFYNNGEITASAYGADSTAIGARIDGGAGTVTFDNAGTISAYSDGTAIAVQFLGTGPLNFTNHGTLVADGGVDSIVIDTTYGAGNDSIYNYGTITGNFAFGAGDDYFYNADGATWNATGYTDFGDGDDTLVNNGDIFMTDATIAFGGYTVNGNLFQNNGNIFADGDNVIDMGAGPSLFVNDGAIDMQDGAADDSLTIYGDFAGAGDINVDVEGNAGVSDMLYIDGNVAADARQTINVDLIDLSAPIADTIPMVEVSGDSTAANFALGDVNFDPNTSFVNLDFSLVSDIDTSNATPDVFSLGIDVVGLTDTGTIAAAVSPAVHSLLADEVGTWRQRQGVIDAFNKGAISLWARVFTNKTNFSPEFASNDIGLSGNFDWSQRNRGVEAGIDFAVTDEFALGLLVAKSKASIDLDPGSADADIDADTWGVYGTWLSPTGFYLDASYRWSKFDTDLNSLAGPMHIDGAKAETFNVELGYAWTLAGGLKIEPQFQWTKTNVKDIDVLTTSSGMTFNTDGADSSRGRLGVAVYKAMGDADTGWQVTPYAALSAVREFDGENDFAINDTLVGRTTTDGTSALLELAVTARHEGLSIWGGVNWQDGGSIDNSWGGQLGVRYSFGGAAPAPAPAPVVAPPAKTCAELDDDQDGVNNCDDRCPSQAGVAPDGCPAPAPAPEPEPAPAPKPYRG